MRRLLCVVFVLFLALFLFYGTTLAASPTKLVYSSFCLESCVQEQIDKWFMSEVEKRTKGQVKFEAHFGGELTKGLETLPMVRSGAVSVCNPPPGYFPDELPLAGMFNVIRIPSDWKVCLDAGYKMFWGEGEVSKILEAEARKQNFVYLYQHPMEYKFITKPAVRTLADLKGIKMRSTGLYEPKHLATWGGISVNVLPAEWYEAISRGTIDGISIPWDMAADYKLQEVVKYASFAGGAILARPVTINARKWEALPDDVKKVIEDLREEVHQKQIEMYPAKLREVEKLFKDAGVKFVDVPKDEQAEVFDTWIKVAIDVWLPNVTKKGLAKEGRLILDRWLSLTTGKGLADWEAKYKN